QAAVRRQRLDADPVALGKGGVVRMPLHLQPVQPDQQAEQHQEHQQDREQDAVLEQSNLAPLVLDAGTGTHPQLTCRRRRRSRSTRNSHGHTSALVMTGASEWNRGWPTPAMPRIQNSTNSYNPSSRPMATICWCTGKTRTCRD